MPTAKARGRRPRLRLVVEPHDFPPGHKQFFLRRSLRGSRLKPRKRQPSDRAKPPK